eukprot:GEMP01104263.1.p1 GENE.GEMP01104263.1~~GEMP01104263.1.p1  ORF type:complete len:195 (+),score=26.02 GEMP01104263.1:48-632(+)
MHFSYALFSIHISMLCWTPIVVKANIPPKRVDDELADQPFQFFGGGIDDEDPGDEDSDDFDASGDENDLSSSDDEGVFYPGDDNMLGSPPLQRVFPLRMRDLEIRVFGFGSCVSVGDDVDDLPASDGEGVFHGDDNMLGPPLQRVLLLGAKFFCLMKEACAACPPPSPPPRRRVFKTGALIWAPGHRGGLRKGF